MLLSRIGPIALEEPLGGSPDSNVLRGVHLERNMAMAVKLLPRALVNRPMGGDMFAADVKALQKLVHPHIARTYGGAMDNGQPYLAMELVRGESLRSLLDRRGRLPWETTVDIAQSVCEALEFAHGQGMVHQRLTPTRILLAESGVKVTGFDCKLADVDDVLGLRSPMSVASYLAPEEFRGKPSASLATCDLFSLGVIMFECLAGRLPWSANSPAELVQAQRDRPAPRVSTAVLDCPVWLDVLVARLLETKRSDRLQSADETRRAIVDAKRKVAEGMGAAQHAWSGKQGALSIDADRTELTKLRRKQAAVREVDHSPFYERAWFLAVCLAALVGVGVWVMWPKSKEALLAAARPLMQSDDPVAWRQAEDDYLVELRERFPEVKDDPEVQEFEMRLAKRRAAASVRTLDLKMAKPKSEAQRLYAEAKRFERFGDLLSAWQMYDKLIASPAQNGSQEERAFVELAKEDAARIKEHAAGGQALAEFVEEKLDRAGRLLDQGQRLSARAMLDDVIALYDGRVDLKPQMEQARAMKAQLDDAGAK